MRDADPSAVGSLHLHQSERPSRSRWIPVAFHQFVIFCLPLIEANLTIWPHQSVEQSVGPHQVGRDLDES
jgi:hypothetical protein